jgi:glycosyltransferase involved in cell wall biosynthesis
LALPLYFVSPNTFEPWDYRNPDTQGIGGSETAQIEMAWRLARRGYDVTCYAPIPADCEPSWRGTTWKHWKEADTFKPGTWILSRCPAFADAFPLPSTDPKKPNWQRLWLICQDMDYPSKETGYTPERVAKFEKIIALCSAQAHGLRYKYPWMAPKIFVSTNGVKLDLIREVEAEKLPRNPHRLFYGSSPDRGLLPLLSIFRRAREAVPDLELEIAYGFDNIDKLPSGAMKSFKEKCLKEANQPGVKWLGRLPQREVARRLFSAGMWCYPFTARVETSAIACMEAQACGAVPICSPVDAVGENVMHGSQIEGDPDDGMVRARFVQEIVRWSDPARQAEVRPILMEDARRRFNWERVCDQYEHWIAGKSGPCPLAQYAFQHRWAKGRILNLGCAEDSTGFLQRGALNVDIVDRHPNGTPNQAHLLADARDLPVNLYHRFNSVILGDILEHFTPEDRVKALVQAKACLSPEGRVIVTWPEDYRTAAEQRVNGEYVPGVAVPHEHAVGLQDMVAAWQAAGLEQEFVQPLDYSFTTGHGAVLK